MLKVYLKNDADVANDNWQWSNYAQKSSIAPQASFVKKKIVISMCLSCAVLVIIARNKHFWSNCI